MVVDNLVEEVPIPTPETERRFDNLLDESIIENQEGKKQGESVNLI